MKGIIVAAGYGSRFLPLTKTIAKEMLPLYDKPSIDFILDEFEDAGIRDIIIITSRRKKMMEDYLDREVELETILTRDGKTTLANAIKPRNLNISFIRQQEMKGTGQALLLVKPYVDGEAFVIAYPDDIIIGKPGASRRMVEIHKKTGRSVMAVRSETENVSRFGVIIPEQQGDSTLVRGMVEKPKPGTEPSNLVSVGRYLFTPELLNILEEEYKSHTSGEFYHIHGINQMAKEGKVESYTIEGTLLDTGEPESYLTSLLTYVDQHPTARAVLDNYLKNRK